MMFRIASGRSYQIISGNDFFQCVRGKRIDTRQVCDDNIFVPFQLTLFLFHGNARPVTYILVCAS